MPQVVESFEPYLHRVDKIVATTSNAPLLVELEQRLQQVLSGESYERFAEQTTENFKRLFPLARVSLSYSFLGSDYQSGLFFGQKKPGLWGTRVKTIRSKTKDTFRCDLNRQPLGGMCRRLL